MSVTSSSVQKPASVWISLLGLAALTLWLLVTPPAGADAGVSVRLVIGAICAAPLVVLLATANADRHKWGVWVAVMMIPYVTFSVGSLLVSPGARMQGALFAAVTVLTFFAGIDAARRP